MKVLVADKFPADRLEELRAAGCDVVVNPDLNGPTLTAAVAETGAEVLVVRSTEVKAETLAVGRLGLVVRAGAGYNTIDTKKASELGIYVSNCPGKNSIAVAELTMGLILALDRQIPDAVADLRAGVWNKGRYGKARGLYGRTLAILGTGNIGREVVRRGARLWSPCAGVEPLADARGRRGDGSHLLRDARRGRDLGGHRLDPPGPEARDARARGPGGLRRAQARRLPDQHGSGRDRRRGCAPRRHQGQRDPCRRRRVRRRAGAERAAASRAPSSRSPA